MTGWYRHRTGMIALAILTLAALACNAPGARGRGTPTLDTTLTYFIDPTLLTPGLTDTPGGPTETPAPTSTNTPGCGYWSEFVDDVTIPDGAEVVAGNTFEKTWRIRNNGCLMWAPGTRLYFWGGDQMGGPESLEVPSVAPNDTIDITVTLTAPDRPGEYTGNWQLITPDGISVGPYVYVQVKVIEGTATPVPAWVDFVGTWVNEDAATTNLTRLAIRVDGNVIYVQMSARCGTSVCTRGEVSTPASDANDRILSLRWSGEEAGKQRSEILQVVLLSDGRLQVNGQVDFTDPTTPDFTYTDYFSKTD